MATDPASYLILSGLAATASYAMMTYCESRRSQLIFTPLSFYFAYNTVAVGLSTVYIGYLSLSQSAMPFAADYVSIFDLRAGFLIFLCGLFAFHIGVELFRPRARPSLHSARHSTTELNALIGVACATIGISIVNAHVLDSIGVSRNFLEWTVQGLPVYVAFRCYTSRRLDKTQQYMLISLLCGILFVYNTLSGLKGAMMFSFWPLIWRMVVIPRERRYILLITLGLIPLYFTVVEPYITYLRTEHQKPQLNSALQDLSTARDQASLVRHENQLNDDLYGVFYRLYDPMPVSYLISYVRENGFARGETFSYLAYAFIPRFVWPDKPVVSRGKWFYTVAGGSRSEDETDTSLGMHAIGELYWNFGATGVVGGMLLLGMLFSALLWRTAGVNPLQDPVRFCLYNGIMLNITNMSEAGSYFVGIVGSYLTYQIILKVIYLLRGEWNISRSKGIVGKKNGARLAPLAYQ